MRAEIFFFIILLIYLLLLRGDYGNITPSIDFGFTSFGGIFESSLERGRYEQAYSIVNHGTIFVEKYKDFVSPDLAWYNNNYTPAFPLGTSLIASFFYLLGSYINLGQLFSYFTSVLFALLCGILIYKIGNILYVNKKISYLSVITFCFFSIALNYTVTLSAHLISAFICSYLFYAVLQKSYKTFYIAVFLYFINLFIDYPNLVILFPLFLYLLYTRVNLLTASSYLHIKLNYKFILFILFALVPITIFIIYNLNVYGKVFTLSNTYNIHVLSKQGVPVDTLNSFVFDSFDYSNKFDLRNSLTGMFVLLFSLDRGLLIFSPVFILSILGYFKFKKDYKYLESVLLSTFILNVFLYGSYDDPWGGWSYGPRYLIVTLPILSLLVGYCLDKVKNTRIVYVILSLVSLFVSLLGSLSGNTLPPSVESAGSFLIHFKTNYVFLLTQSSSFVYKMFFAPYLQGIIYFASLYILISFFLLFYVYANKE